MTDHSLHTDLFSPTQLGGLSLANRFQSGAARALIDFLSDRMGLARIIRPGDLPDTAQALRPPE